MKSFVLASDFELRTVFGRGGGSEDSSSSSSDSGSSGDVFSQIGNWWDNMWAPAPPAPATEAMRDQIRSSGAGGNDGPNPLAVGADMTGADWTTSLADPFGALAVDSNKSEAESKVGYLSREQPEFVDAVRHAYWSAMNATDLGEARARQFGNAHENYPGNPVGEKQMDLYNNEIGYRIARENPGLSNEQLFEKVQEAKARGELQLNP